VAPSPDFAAAWGLELYQYWEDPLPLPVPVYRRNEILRAVTDLKSTTRVNEVLQQMKLAERFLLTYGMLPVERSPKCLLTENKEPADGILLSYS
jgi:hypothetical protein